MVLDPDRLSIDKDFDQKTMSPFYLLYFALCSYEPAGFDRFELKRACSPTNDASIFGHGNLMH